MVDNVAITAGTGTTVAADDIGGVFYQRVKIALGADGVANDASAGAGAVGTGTQRVTLASDDPGVSHLSRLTSSATNVAAGSALATTSFIVGSRYNSTPPTFTDGQEGALQITAAGALITSDPGVNTSLAIIDDWDESDRAKVNPIVGQAGIAAGAGAVGATVPRVTLASDDPGVTKLNTIAKAVEGDYETVAASQTAQVLGGTGATGDFISHILVVPATTSPGNVLLLDNATSITVFAGGASSVSNLVPFVIPLNLYSVSGALKITTGANVSVVAVGSFSA